MFDPIRRLHAEVAKITEMATQSSTEQTDLFVFFAILAM
jgi:hypothetical protein